MAKLKDKLTRLLVSMGVSVVLAGGVGVASANMNHYPNNWHDKDRGNTSSVENNSTVGVENEVDQNATTGEAVVTAAEEENNNCHMDNFRMNNNHCNWDDEDEAPAVLGDATTGSASNTSSVGMGISITNSSCGCATTETIRRESSSSVRIENNNEVEVANTVTQNATSGDATVVGGSEGSATTGNASNSSSSTITISVSN